MLLLSLKPNGQEVMLHNSRGGTALSVKKQSKLKLKT
jgi:hypothetical protein